MRRFLALLLCGLCGCSTTNLTKVLEAAGKDHAHWHIEVKSIYGSVTIDREMPQGAGTNVTTTSTAVIRH